MKKIIISLFIITLSTNVFAQQHQMLDAPPYILSAKEGKYFSNEDGDFLSVPTELTNNTPDTLKYVIMTCPVNSYYKVDSEMLEWGEPRKDCSGTIPRILIIPPHKSNETIIKLKVRGYIKGGLIEYRIGFDLYDNPPNYIANFLDINPKLTPKLIGPKELWSNTVKMKLPD